MNSKKKSQNGAKINKESMQSPKWHTAKGGVRRARASPPATADSPAAGLLA